MRLRKNWQELKDQRGAAIVSVMVIIIFISGVVIGLMFWLWSESKRSTQIKAQTKAVYLAEAGTQKALWRLKNESQDTNEPYNMFIDSITATGDEDNFTLVFPGTGTVTVTVREIN